LEPTAAPDVRAVLWDADGVLQDTPADTWDIAVSVVSQFSDVLTGGPIDEGRIRSAARAVGLDHRVDDVLSVWWTFEVLAPTLAVVADVRALGIACYLATNQDRYRASCMRQKAPYEGLLDGSYYSCEMGVAKPSTAFFDHIAADLGLAPQQLLFIDDQPANVAAARAAGLRAACWTHAEGTPRLRDLLAAHGLDLH
jgi:putative hydrolase of the HAD superfamily